MGFILMLTAYILLTICAPFGFLWALFKQPKKYFFRIAVSLDQLANVICLENLNAWLIIDKSKHLFGNPDETISSVLGKNKLNGTLSKFGRFIDKVLNKLDDNHSINSIEEDETN
jgi:8-oxo-dGTP diphosphatase